MEDNYILSRGEMIYRYNLSFVSILQTGSRWLVEVLA